MFQGNSANQLPISRKMKIVKTKGKNFFPLRSPPT